MQFGCKFTTYNIDFQAFLALILSNKNHAEALVWQSVHLKWQAVTPSLGGNDSLPLYTSAMIHRHLAELRRESKLGTSVTRHASQQFWEVVPERHASQRHNRFWTRTPPQE